MAYLDNSSEITIDATLTRKGREMLAMGQSLNITKFAVADDEIDYSLYDPAHPRGSAYYDSAITALPILEASVDETKMLRYKLMTMGRGVTFIPTLTITPSNVLSEFKWYPNQNDGQSFMETQEVNIISQGPVQNTSFTIVLGDYEAGTILNSTSDTRSPGSEVRTVTFHVQSSRFTFQPNTVDLNRSISTTLIITGDQTGATVTIPVKIDYIRG